MNMIRHGPAPSDRAASMYSFSLRDSVWPRTTRAMPAQEKNEMTARSAQAGPEHHHQGQGQDEVREGEHGVDDPHQNPVDPARRSSR